MRSFLIAVTSLMLFAIGGHAYQAVYPGPIGKILKKELRRQL